MGASAGRLGLFLLVLTCVCGGGCGKSEEHERESSPPAVSPAPKPTAAKPDNRPVIVAFGNSLSEGYGADPGKSYPDFLQQELDSGGHSYRVVNLGISGDTTTGGLGRIQSAVDLKPKIVILELGGNDGLRGLPVSASRSNLEQMILTLRHAAIRVVLAGMTLPPDYGPDYIRTFEAMYEDLAAKYKLTLIPFLLEDIRTQLKTRTDLMQRDGIHPTAAGNRIVAATVYKALEPELKR